MRIDKNILLPALELLAGGYTFKHVATKLKGRGFDPEAVDNHMEIAKALLSRSPEWREQALSRVCAGYLTARHKALELYELCLVNDDLRSAIAALKLYLNTLDTERSLLPIEIVNTQEQSLEERFSMVFGGSGE